MDALHAVHGAGTVHQFVKFRQVALHCIAQPVHMQDLLRGKAGAALVHHSTVLRGNIAGKRVNAARNNAAAQDVGQVAHIMGQLAAEQFMPHQ